MTVSVRMNAEKGVVVCAKGSRLGGVQRAEKFAIIAR